MPGPATVAFTAGEVVNEGDAAAIRELSGYLVSEHRPRRGEADLLDVAAAEAAGENGDELPGPLGSGMSARAGSLSSSRTTARMRLS